MLGVLGKLEKNKVQVLCISILQFGWGEKMCIFGNDLRWRCGYIGQSVRLCDVGMCVRRIQRVFELVSFIVNLINLIKLVRKDLRG